MENLPYLNYLINQINKENNWTVKIIYLDLYFDLVVPNFVITENLNLINNDINNLKQKNDDLEKKINEIATEKKENTILENKNDNIIEQNEISHVKEQIKDLTSKYNKMIEFMKKYFNEKELSDFLKNSEKQEEYPKEP